MKKRNGFVFIETIVVVSVLSLTLLLLFSSYSYILRKARERNTFDTTETIYKTYYVKSIIDSLYVSAPSGVRRYIDDHDDGSNPECYQMKPYLSYSCTPKKDGDLYQVVNAFEVEKFYFINPARLFENSEDVQKNWLILFDATTIDYLKELGPQDADLLIVKYRKKYNNTNGDYEVIHSSIEVK